MALTSYDDGLRIQKSFEHYEVDGHRQTRLFVLSYNSCEGEEECAYGCIPLAGTTHRTIPYCPPLQFSSRSWKTQTYCMKGSAGVMLMSSSYLTRDEIRNYIHSTPEQLTERFFRFHCSLLRPSGPQSVVHHHIYSKPLTNHQRRSNIHIFWCNHDLNAICC